MDNGHNRGRLDWLVELTGASAPAMAAGYAASELAPLNGWPLWLAMLASLGGTFVAAYIALRSMKADARHLKLPDFECPMVPGELLPDDVLLLDRRWIASPVDAATEAVAELLLDDPLTVPAADSRVVQLFADGRMPTAGQLQQRIDRHLADGQPGLAPHSDASDALSDALAELRRSLRQA